MVLSRYFLSILWMMQASITKGQTINRGEAIDSTIRDVKRVVIGGVRYTGIMTQDSVYLRDRRGHNLLRLLNDYFSFEFKDYNGDGYRDLLLEVGGNTPEVMDVYLYSPSRHGFRELKDAREFPAPTRIKGTPYYYSYHKGGCADLIWGSDLFYIHNGAAIALGNIHGEECKIEEGVYIYKIRSGKKQLVKKLPIATIHTYKDDKWGFIEAYWKKNYKRFR